MAKLAGRLVAMLELIPSRPRKITTSKLKELLAGLGFNVSERTIQRDLHHLSADFPIVLDDRAKPFGWSREQSSTHRGANPNPYESLTFALAYTQLLEKMPRGLRDYLDPRMQEVQDELARSKNSKLASWPTKVMQVSSGFRLIPANFDSSVLDEIYEAVFQERQLALNYRGKSQAVVNSLGVIFRGHAVFLVCTFRGFHDIRQLAIHRIENPKLQLTEIDKPVGFSLKKYCRSAAMGVLKSNTGLDVELKMTKPAAAHLFETPISQDQTISNFDEDNVLVKATVDDSKDFRWWILGFGGQVEVLSPIELRNEISKQAVKMYNLYAPDSVTLKKDSSVSK